MSSPLEHDEVGWIELYGVESICELLPRGTKVRWIPVAPLPMTEIPQDAATAWNEAGILESARGVVLVEYTDANGIEKRGYTERTNLRFLGQVDEPTK